MKNRKSGNPLDRWETTPANRVPDWLPSPASGDIESFQSLTLEEAMQKKRLLCIYWLLQEGRTPQQDGFTDFITETVVRDQDARFVRVFLEADKSRTVQKNADEIVYALADRYLQMEIYHGTGAYYGASAVRALFYICGINDTDADEETVKALSSGDRQMLGNISGEKKTHTLTLLFRAVPPHKARALLETLHEKATEHGNLPVMQWLQRSNLYPVSENDIFQAADKQMTALAITKDGTERHTKNKAVKNWIENASPALLLSQDGKLLHTATQIGSYEIVETLLKKTHDWPQEIVEPGMRSAFEKNDRDMMSRLGSLKAEWQIGLLKEFEKDTSSEKRSIQQTIHYLKKAYLEDGWSVLNKNEISRSVSTVNTSITHLFNFRSKTVTTTAVPSGGRGAALQVTNFREFQSGDEIGDAYWRLRIFHDDAPPYKGKDDSARHRAIHRTRPNRTGGSPHA